MVEGEKSLTPAGNVKAPSLTTMTSWVLEAWRGLPKEMVARSFKKCGISNSIDGTEDDILWEEEANPEQESEDDESEDKDVYDDKLTEEQWRSLLGDSDDEDEFVYIFITYLHGIVNNTTTSLLVSFWSVLHSRGRIPCEPYERGGA